MSDLRFTGRRCESCLGSIAFWPWAFIYTCVPLSPSSIIWYHPSGGDIFGWESNRGPGGKKWQPTTELLTNVICRLTAKKPGSALSPMLIIIETVNWFTC